MQILTFIPKSGNSDNKSTSINTQAKKSMRLILSVII